MLPFSEVIDWSRVSVRLWGEELGHIAEILQAYPDEEELRHQVCSEERVKGCVGGGGRLCDRKGWSVWVEGWEGVGGGVEGCGGRVWVEGWGVWGEGVGGCMMGRGGRVDGGKNVAIV